VLKTMNRWTDLLASFGIATLLHGLLVLGAVWFWTLRPPELRPIFQDGDVSLAVTFVAAARDGGQTTDNRRQRTDGGQQAPDIGSRKPGTTDILTDPETEMPEDRRQTTRDAWQATDLSRVARDDRRQTTEEEGEDQDMLDAETAAPVSAQASANAPEDGRQTDSAAEPSSDTLRQGVSGAVRMQSEIRPYYPLGARLRGEEGAVTVRVWVKPSGRARRCEVAHSSGYPALDEAAVDAARRARYVSTRLGAWRAEVETTLTFQFRLTE
jgi:TonB family protein